MKPKGKAQSPPHPQVLLMLPVLLLLIHQKSLLHLLLHLLHMLLHLLHLLLHQTKKSLVASIMESVNVDVDGPSKLSTQC